MTELLRRAIAQVEKLSADAQDAIAARILADLADDEAWATRFAATTDEQWERLVGEVRRDVAASGATPPETVFPPG